MVNVLKWMGIKRHPDDKKHPTKTNTIQGRYNKNSDKKNRTDIKHCLTSAPEENLLNLNCPYIT